MITKSTTLYTSLLGRRRGRHEPACNVGTTANSPNIHRVDPRDKLWKKESWSECGPDSDEIPYGWEIVHDNLCGKYFVDHINQRTLLDDPRTNKAKDQVEEMKQFVKSGAIEAIEDKFVKKMEELRLIEANVSKMDAGEGKESELQNGMKKNLQLLLKLN